MASDNVRMNSSGPNPLLVYTPLDPLAHAIGPLPLCVDGHHSTRGMLLTDLNF